MASNNLSFKQLSKSYKGLFPFRICAPSFIYPDHWIPNIRFLAPCLDEIEILLFDSLRETDFPSEGDIGQMAKLGSKNSIRYNIHLPTDISPGSPDADTRQKAIDAITRTYHLVLPLNPTACILHLPLDGPVFNKSELSGWRQRIAKSVETLILNGIPGQSLSVETLDYPLEWVRPVIETFDLAVCLDVGHLLAHGIDWQSEYRQWGHRINMIHLHGIKDRDHCSLDAIPPSIFKKILLALKSFTGTVSVEVFGFEDLQKSLMYLERYWQDIRLQGAF